MSDEIYKERSFELPPHDAVYDDEGNLHVVVSNGGMEPHETVRVLPKSDAEPRPSGLGKGIATVHDSFFDPLPDEVLDYFDPNPPESTEGLGGDG